VLDRQNDEVDDGWLCDKGRFAYQSFHSDERITEPLVRDGGVLRPVTWERALEHAAEALRRAGANAAAIAGGQATGEEGHLLARLMREALGSPHLDSRRGGVLSLDAHRALGAPALQAKVSDLEFAHAVLVLDADPVNDASILDLRLRKGIRRRGLKLAVASPGPSSLDPSAALSIRFKAGAGAAFAAALGSALGTGAELESLCGEAGVESAAVRELAELLRGGESQQGDDGESSA
jgi:NADH-quinone oxidoreductase subunit G